MRYEKLLMKDKQPKHTAMLFQCISIMAFTSFLLLCCRQDSMEILQTVGQINIINKTGEEIVIQTNINENPLLPGLAYSLKANGTYWQTIARVIHYQEIWMISHGRHGMTTSLTHG